jgi:hypothetical protein
MITGMTRTNCPDQLQLLAPVPAPVQLRLDERTRRIGLAGVAKARAVLAEQAKRREATQQADRVERADRAGGRAA